MRGNDAIKRGVDSRFKEVACKLKKKTGCRLDKKGFFVVHVDSRNYRIVVEHYAYDRKLKNKFLGTKAKELCDTILDNGLVSDLGHASYLGRELAKAEIALKNGLKYRQDKSLVI